MKEFKEKPKMGKTKEKRQAALSPRQAARMMKEKYLNQLDQRPDGPVGDSGYAPEQVERAGRWAVDELTDTVRRPDPHRRGPKERPDPTPERPAPGQEQPSADLDHPAPEGNGQRERPANAPKERGRREFQSRAGERAASQSTPSSSPADHSASAPRRRADAPIIKERGSGLRAPGPTGRTPAITPDGAHAPGRPASPRQAPRPFTLNNRRRGSAALHRPPSTTGPRSAQAAPAGERRRAFSIKERPRTNNAVKTRAAHLPGGKAPPGPKVRSAPPLARQTVRTAREAARHQAARQMLAQAGKTAKSAAAVFKRLAQAVVKAVAALTGAVLGIAGGAIVLVALVIIIVIAAVANSPFGLFFAAERNAPDTVSVSEAVAQVNVDYNAKLEELQAGDYDSIVIHGQAPDWPDVLAVFASRYAGAEDGVDVATLDADRVAKLTAVFWDMTAISTEVETIDHPGDGEDDPGWTEYILHITVTAKSAEDMKAAYDFTAYQISALDELLADRAALASLAGSLTITNADARAVLDALPEDLTPERRAAVETALSLYGKVNYFWGGKSYVIGWDSRWGQLMKVTSPGSSTTGTYRPFGLDCTGFLDWSFRNAGLRSDGHWYVETNLTEVSAADALPGDIALFPDASHVGLVVGRDETGRLLVCHCSFSQNNVVVTGFSAAGFTVVGRPDIYGD